MLQISLVPYIDDKTAEASGKLDGQMKNLHSEKELGTMLWWVRYMVALSQTVSQNFCQHCILQLFILAPKDIE